MGEMDVRISLDDTQQMLGSHYKNYRTELKDFYEDIQKYIVEKALSENLTVWVDNTNMSVEERSRYIPIAKMYGAEVEAVDFTHLRETLTDQILLERRMNESRDVKESTWARVISEMWDRYVPVAKTEGINRIRIVHPDEVVDSKISRR